MGILGHQHTALPSGTGTWWKSGEAPGLAKECAKGSSFVLEGGKMYVPSQLSVPIPVNPNTS